MAPALCLGILSVLMLLNGVAMAQLNASYYSTSCPNLAYTVRSKVRQAVRKEARMGASLLRLHFHDCFVNGCDGSILLDDTSSFTGEKTAGPNNNSVRGFDVVDTVKSAVESGCPGVVSCADILALIAREAVLALGGPSWTVYYGRRDSTTASFSSANSDIPTPSSSVSELTSKFSAKGLSVTDLVALSGAHTLGQARCTNFRNRLYNFSGSGQADPNLLQAYAASLKSKCPSSGSDNALSSLDLKTPNYFDNKYYSNLQAKKGLLNSDQVLYTTSGSTNTLVNTYATNPSRFLNDFKNAMVNLGNISPLTGSSGQIRKTCRFVNSS